MDEFLAIMGGKSVQKKSNLHGYLVAVDGPNGVGKSTLIKNIEIKLKFLGYRVYTTKEPTNTELGKFVRKFSENHSGMSLACLVAADRYEHIVNEIIPELQKESIVITDRYILSSLILQQMDGVNSTFIFDINADIIKPDLQVAVFADEEILRKRLAERNVLTRFEKENQSNSELYYLEKGISELEKENINIIQINNNDHLKENVEKVVSYIIDNWRKI